MPIDADTAPLTPLKFPVPPALLASALPTSVDELQALVRTQYERAISLACAQVFEQNQALIDAQVARQVEQQVKRQVAEQVAEQLVLARHEFDQKIQAILEQLVLARRRQFGASSEVMSGQGHLFNEAEALAAGDEDDEAAHVERDTVATPGTKAARGKRRPLPADLPRVDIVHDVPQDQRTCACGTPMVPIGEEVSEQLDIIPMQIRVLRHIRRRYACPHGDAAPVTAVLPSQPLPRSNASPSFLAMLATVKFVDGLPLARFEHVLARSGVAVPRNTLARYIIGAAKVLQPLHNLMRDHLLESPLIHMDETVVQVLKEPGKAASSQSYMWVQTGGPPGKPVVLFDYDTSRSGQVPLRLLDGWHGFLMTDGYEGYGAAVQALGLTHLICFAHARRKFVEAKSVQPKGQRGRADQAIEHIARLYRIERELKEACDADRLVARQTRSRPVLQALREWLDKTRPVVTPQSALGRALAYLDKYWSRLIRYTERGDLPIDNNRCENAIRPFVVGRRAWLFSDTPAGAHASAVLYSLVETVKANGLDPYAWFLYAFTHLPRATTVEEIEALLPWNLHAHDLATTLAD